MALQADPHKAQAVLPVYGGNSTGRGIKGRCQRDSMTGPYAWPKGVLGPNYNLKFARVGPKHTAKLAC